MKQTLVIGSTVVDVLLNIPFLPRQGNDINITSSEYRIGGCAYNVFKTLIFFNSPAVLCSPVGTGVYGRMVREHLDEEGLLPIASLETANGCCYCLIEPNGERTFLSHHGAEYVFSKSWMTNLNLSMASGVYISGIDAEEPTGDEIADFVEEHPELKLYFAPGPRIINIPSARMQRLLGRRDSKGRGPLLHLNESEAMCFSGKNEIEAAAKFLAEKTSNIVVITLGQRGCYCFDTEGHYIPGFPADTVDTTGAGDVHCGALIACLTEGMNLIDACHSANKAGAEAVGIHGTILEKLPELAAED